MPSVSREGDAPCYPSPVSRDERLARISIDPKICFGKPCIKGHRIWVSLILDLLATGSTMQELLADYPGVTEPDVMACIAYGAEMSRERYVDVPLRHIATKPWDFEANFSCERRAMTSRRSSSSR